MPPPPVGSRVRLLGRVCIGLFAISTVFPLVAGIIPSVQGHKWLGAADVGIAVALVFTAIAVASRTRATVTDHDRHAAFRATQVVIGVVPALLVLFFVAGDRVAWEILVVGLAWRGWLLIYTLPYLVAAVTDRAADPSNAHAESLPRK